ncbi:MAG: MFS transporter [Acetobacteraceae bacterium]
MSESASREGRIAARIDRLPLTRIQWELAILVEVAWGFIIVDTDGIAARLYPFVWKPHHLITDTQYAVIQALQVGLGVLLGAFLMSWVAGRFGRRPAIIASAVLGGLFLWPFVFVTNYWGLVVLSALSTLGVGGIVATHAVYLAEMIHPQARNKLLLASQGATGLVFVVVSLMAYWWIPGQWQLFVWVSAAIEILGLVPLLLWRLPESPRWLEAHGHHDRAEAAMARLEARCVRASGAALPEPAVGLHPVIPARPGAWREIFTAPEYRTRSILILACWMLSYPGMIYGVGAFMPVFMVDHGASPHFVFGLLVIASAATFFALVGNGWLGERIERRDVLLAMGVLFAACWLWIWINPTAPVMAVAFIIGRIATILWLFNLYNYTAVSFPTRLRSTAFAWTDGLGHLGAWAGVTLVGPLFAIGPDHMGWVLWIVFPGALLPALLIRALGIRQAHAVLEQVST